MGKFAKEKGKKKEESLSLVYAKVVVVFYSRREREVVSLAAPIYIKKRHFICPTPTSYLRLRLFSPFPLPFSSISLFLFSFLTLLQL